ncbi:MAG: L-Ala-D/L-Glu epimerase [Solirubrobacteraceae bacterium]|jgi:L-alanine-DL-glutamate epimerase-like enolase superfamily enzyme|nr:L-Ala-D/L-Glu epimerase [Solirubrobacteraceae bacterium]
MEVERVAYRFRAPVETAFGSLESREVLRVRVGGGVGEAAPLEPYDGVSLEDVEAALRAAAVDEPDAETALARLAGGPPQARAAVEMAAWDARGRRREAPVASLLADGPFQAVPVNALIGEADRAGASRAAAEAVRAGFRCVKVKVATGDDAGRLAAVRAAVGPDVAIRIDANGAWTVDEAVVALESLAPVGIELCEEPVHGVAALREVRARVDVPIAMDETVTREPGAAGSGATHAVCLKIAALGGIGPLMDAAASARAAGSDVYLASTFDGPIGIAAALHVAAALRVTRPCGLATLALFADTKDPFPPHNGTIHVPDAAGLLP